MGVYVYYAMNVLYNEAKGTSPKSDVSHVHVRMLVISYVATILMRIYSFLIMQQTSRCTTSLGSL